MTVIINGDTGISGVNGSAANPAIKGSDADTGIHFGSDSATITTGGTERVSVDSTGAATFSGTVKTSKVENANTSNGGLEIDTSGHVQLDGLQIPTAGALSNRNMAMNGSMCVCQRPTSISLAHDGTTATHMPDRFQTSLLAQELDGTLERIYDGATGAPGLPNSLKWTTGTAEAAVTGTDIYYIAQYIEGLDVQAPAFGTPAAQPTTISFWVKCSLTGTFVFSIYRGHSARNIARTYTVNVADTWEYKEITLPADTTGVATANTSAGVRLNWHLMAGPGFQGVDASEWGVYSTARWAGVGITNNSICTTAGATWEITGVQYEVGSKATPFEHEHYCSVLQKCKRYFQYTNELGAHTGVGNGSGETAWATWYHGDSGASTRLALNVSMRASPGVTIIGSVSGQGSGVSPSTGGSGTIGAYYAGVWQPNATWNLGVAESTPDSVRLNASGLSAGAAGHAGALYFYGDRHTSSISCSAEF